MLLLPISPETIFPDSEVSKAVVLKYSIKDVPSYTFFSKMEQDNFRMVADLKVLIRIAMPNVHCLKGQI